MITLWEQFCSEHQVNIVFEWNIKETLQRYTQWLAVQDVTIPTLQASRRAQQQAHADFNYEGE